MTKPMTLRDGHGWVMRGDGMLYTAMSNEYVAEIERLQAALATANANHERFEREWYLRGDEIERLQAENARYVETIRKLVEGEPVQVPAERTNESQS